MFRTRALARVPLGRALSSGRILRERAPTFTTPAPAPAPAPAPVASTPASKATRGAAHAADLPPLPPTNLPVEDYASPLLHTASFFSTLFRYSVYSSVAIVTAALTSLVGVHLYVEHSALALPPDHRADDPDEWATDATEGWSGKHLGSGGTDPRLGVLARAAIRGAWISMNWVTGTTVSPVSRPATFAVPSGGPGPRMIGQAEALASRGTPVADGGWIMAEQYLVFAIKKAQERGISLTDSSDWEAHIERGGVDRAAVELEERLAGVRERIGGRIKLEQARESWHKIYSALEQSPTTDLSTPEGRRLVAWEQREKLLASRKLGQLGGSIAEHWGKTSSEGQIESERAQEWFVRGLTPILDTRDASQPTPASVKHVSPSSSFFSFWSRSHPPSTPTAGSSLSDLSRLASLVSSTAPTALSPSTSRAVLASLVSLETFLARTASDLGAAKSIQTCALEYAKTLAASTPRPESSSRPSLPPKTVAQASTLLMTLYLTTRIAALESHLAECTLASLQRERSRSLASARQAALGSLHSTKETIQSVLLTLPATATGKDDSSKKRAFAQMLPIDDKTKTVFEEQSRTIRRDAEKVDKIVASLIEVLESK